MRGHHPRYRPGGRGQPPQRHPPPQELPPELLPFNPNFVPLQDPNFFLHNFTNALLQQSFPMQNPNFFLPPQQQEFPFQQQLQFREQQHQEPPPPGAPPPPQEQQKQQQEPPTLQQNLPKFPQNPKKKVKQDNKELQLERADRAVEKARQDLFEAEENVSSWKVSQSVLVNLQAESWDSLGFRMQEVPALFRLMVTEGKINAFIHCFVGVRRITSIYDLEVAICKNEGVENFEELGLGPLMRHPLVLHYFSMKPDASTEVFKITSEEIILWLSEFMGTCQKKVIIVDEFLYFLAKNYSVKGPEMLGVRIQSLGTHISFIREAKASENSTQRKCREILARNGTLKKCQDARSSGPRVRPRRYEGRFSSEKEQLEERFSAVRERIKSFSQENNGFCGKHIRFVSSSSEDEKSDDGTYDNETTSNNVGSHSKYSAQAISSSDRVSRCPYPSAIEEMSRLGLKGEMGVQFSPDGGSSRPKESNRSFLKKRKLEDVSSVPSKLLRSSKKHVHPIDNCDKTEMFGTPSEDDISLSSNSLRAFITTWKEACKDYTVAEENSGINKVRVLCLKKQGGNIVFSSAVVDFDLYRPLVTSIKCGMWDSIYDTFQVISQPESANTPSGNCSEYECIDVEPSEKQAPVVCVPVEEIIEKITTYYELHCEYQSNGKTILENKFISMGKLSSCELWLVDQFGVKEFKSLGHGEFFVFLEKHASLLPAKLQNLLSGDGYEKSPLEVSMLQHQLMVLVSQASYSLWENQTITKQMIAALLTRQFPLLSFKIMENGSIEDFQQIVGKYKNNVISKCVLFSATLSGMHRSGDSLPLTEDKLETNETRNKGDDLMVAFSSITSKDAIEVLLRAPMLSDLNSWSHWDLKFAPSLGPLVGWLLSEVNAKELMCLVTNDGKVIRIDQSATADSFLEAALQRSSFQTAVKLLSFHAFEVILKNHSENMEVEDDKNCFLHGKAVGVASNNLSVELQKNSFKINQAMHFASRFVLDCLGFMPAEFHGFAADVLLSGMQSVIKEASSLILYKCNQKERLMLHEIGLSIGVVDWVDDYLAFCSDGTTDLSVSSGSSCLETVRSEISTENVTRREDVNSETYTQVRCTIDGAVVSSDEIGSGCMEQSSDLDKHKDAAMVIESIRKEEFGLDANLSNTESSMLKKQHARLGRALHCLSQELYSQDSHFLLELVQNADDNIYPKNMEPTLTFILQESGIIVLNNEQGFSAQNIRALCDVGNSTKKGSGGGYIGQKGIGFKSVFRITDAPEIHSNGFHIKFDIGEGQIGFVLPTVVPPCDINFFSHLAAIHPDQMTSNSWNTCIVLPFRSKSEETAMKMFSDLHPSLLLFLQRLQCIMFRNMLNDSLIIMRKEILEDGIVKVSCGKDKMSWLVASQKLEAHASRPKVQRTEIAIAFTLEESDNGEYNPRLDQQPVFAFLPLRTYGLKFILQGDFILPSSREEVDKNNPWNEWLLTKFPGLFVSAERSFCALSCFRENPGKAVAAYMSFVPLVGEVHGFFSGLPKAIALELRRTSCLLLEGDRSKMVPPCSVLRGWDEQARNLLPDSLLQEYLGLGFLDKNIVLSDSLARALGIMEYGPETLIKFMSHLCRTENGLKLMGLGWLSSWLNTLYAILSRFSGQTDLIDDLRHIPFIPLSDGTYSSVDVGTIWLHSDTLTTGFDRVHRLEAFPKLNAKLQIVNPALLSASAVDGTLVDNVARMLHRIGVQELSAHEIIKVHILQAISDDRITDRDKDLMIDYLCFIMIHLQSGCSNCCDERKHLIYELQNKAYILTNHGYRRPVETSIHFSREFGNPIDMNKLINMVDMRWHEVDISYLKHPANKSLSNGLMKWREFLQEIGVTDFVRVIQIEKSVADLCHSVPNNMAWDTELFPPGLTAKDWESSELVHLLSILSTSGDGERCKYLLEVLDMLWDDNFSHKATSYYDLKSSNNRRAFKSSFISKICDFQWVVSSMDNELHYPKDLFYDCDAVRSILGAAAPYALPKVSSRKLSSELGLKTEVTIDDALEIVGVWRKSETSFKASIAQMSKLYTFIWDEISSSRNKVSEAFRSGPFIFVPCKSGSRHEDLVPGVFLSAEDVYWHDPTGSMDRMKEIHPQGGSTSVTQCPLSKTLCNVYPGLRDFFVNECGVSEIPTYLSYLDILLQLSIAVLPSQAASTVFKVLLMWAEGLKSGSLNSEDVIHLKECLTKLDYTVLPTAQDKWVSLDPSFGLVCWSDDKNLQKIFKNFDNIDFLYFGSLSGSEREMLKTQVSLLLQNLGIPALSEVVTRKAIYDGPADSSFKASLINWALPYAQRYIYSTHPNKYSQLKQSGFNNLKQLQVIAVEKLSYHYAIKKCHIVSMRKEQCSCLLEGNTLYTRLESDSHALFLELSRLFFDGTPELHLANFLHMITTMAESGSTEEQTEFFILNSQKVAKLPDDESVWLLSSPQSLTKNDESLQIDVSPRAINEQKPSKFKLKASVGSYWPPADWKTAPDFHNSRHSINDEQIVIETVNVVPVKNDVDFTIENNADELPESDNVDTQTPKFNGPELGPSKIFRTGQLRPGTADAIQAMLTGKDGEQVAFNYLTGKFGGVVKWVNQDHETGLPYDMVIEVGSSTEYVEVKATRSGVKNWFEISFREWKFAVEKGESFSILHVLLGNNKARVTTFRNPVRQCQLGKLRLVVLMPSVSETWEDVSLLT
ncbi:unnamed protein product [Dovyalis caffra]|uniref:Protein NO VEIN C-terminal domain-containing protein n=1 Tax=Dovyalis caffra TaxID=77055 RepID=A0AAV1R633_9ROSI|nr:unnamed protein product [Dovyalis caffra]